MINLVILIPAALFLGGVGLITFLWTLKSGQYDDLDGAAERILLDQPAEDGRGRVTATSSEGTARRYADCAPEHQASQRRIL